MRVHGAVQNCYANLHSNQKYARVPSYGSIFSPIIFIVSKHFLIEICEIICHFDFHFHEYDFHFHEYGYEFCHFCIITGG